MDELTLQEQKAITRLRKAFDALSKTLVAYVIDDNVVICKRGVSANEICEHVGIANPTNMITDIHDDLGFGL